MTQKIKIGIVDDHQLFLKSLSLMIETFKTFEVVLEALNGEDLQNKIKVKSRIPDMLLIDINMPVLNGFETAEWMQKNHPEIKLIALSMNADDRSIIGMIKAGCSSYLLKDTHPADLEKALNEVHLKGYYNADAANINYRRLLLSQKEYEPLVLSDKEKTFLQLACSDYTYKMIASEMKVSERSIDFMRETLFNKFNVQSRVGLCLEAIRKGVVSL